MLFPENPFYRFMSTPFFHPDTGADGADGGDDGAGGDGTDGGDGGSDGGEGDDKGGKNKGGKGDDDRRVPYTRFAKVSNELSTLRTAHATVVQERDTLKAQVEGKEKADAVVTKQLNDEKTTNNTIRGQLKSERLANAFILESHKAGVQWADMDDAIRLADFSTVEVSDDLKVSREDMAEVVKDLAKKKPHMTKQVQKEDPRFPGGKPGGNGGGGGGGKTPAELARERAVTRNKGQEVTNDPWKR